ncbi:unnamed protein product [Cuscuta campestris]|uniref:Pentacotripeptide-repeat region of PRORP domain-containing protein n=1 Tax=Cuscuta campestris TaxID=132261 RepID=A0A484L0D2_9ASTE|nr:unnamed protein product [Cuscuta campestris]
MDKWVEQGNELTRTDIHMALRYLRQRKLYAKALKVSEWLESSNHIELTELDYSGQVDLIAKVCGLQVAEARIEKIAEPFRSERVYQALLANCVSTFNMRKSEEVFKKMTDLRLPISCFTCNQLLLLYKQADKKKIANVLLLMEKENVKPNLFTYKILMVVKGQCDDIAGMEEVIEKMKNDGVEPDISTKCLIARIYIRCGLNEKGEAMMKDMESDPVGGKSWAFTNLLLLYAILGKEDEVSRIWKLCEPNPRLEQCAAAIAAWGRLKNIEKAEEMLAKGKDLVMRMRKNGCHIGVSTWNSLVKLYIVAGELKKAEGILAMASKQKGMKPLLTSYIAIIEEYAKKGDVHSCEEIFLKMRNGGFLSIYWLYQTLVKAYVNANLPAYGMKERMKGDGVFPGGVLLTLLHRVNPLHYPSQTTISNVVE